VGFFFDEKSGRAGDGFAKERLWGAKLGTPEGDRLDLRATLIDAYEAEHFPIDSA
jgi:hypothetical protein